MSINNLQRLKKQIPMLMVLVMRMILWIKSFTLKNTIDTLGFDQKEARTSFENDYNTLVTGTPEDKAKVVQKYYYPVYQTKMPIYPTQTVVTGQLDADEVDFTDILEDTDPNYSG